jgi:hypothetical protein
MNNFFLWDTTPPSLLFAQRQPIFFHPTSTTHNQQLVVPASQPAQSAGYLLDLADISIFI